MQLVLHGFSGVASSRLLVVCVIVSLYLINSKIISVNIAVVTTCWSIILTMYELKHYFLVFSNLLLTNKLMF